MDDRPAQRGFMERLRGHKLANRLTGGWPLLLLAVPGDRVQIRLTDGTSRRISH